MCGSPVPTITQPTQRFPEASGLGVVCCVGLGFFFKATSRVLLKFAVKILLQSIISKASCTFLTGKSENRIRHYSKYNKQKHEINYPHSNYPT